MDEKKKLEAWLGELAWLRKKEYDLADTGKYHVLPFDSRVHIYRKSREIAEIIGAKITEEVIGSSDPDMPSMREVRFSYQGCTFFSIEKIEEEKDG